MIHYHGLPITPSTAAVAAIYAGHAFISYTNPIQLTTAMEICQSFAIDNGAFSAWKNGKPIADWSKFYAWIDSIMRHPGFDFAVIPDVIDGGEEQNDALLEEWPHGKWIGAPVWHMHESIERLSRLASTWPRVCIGSSAQYSVVGDEVWRKRMAVALNAICVDGLPIAKIHGLRMLSQRVFRHLPFASADSTNIARNIGIDALWKGTYLPPTKEARAKILRDRIEHVNSSQRWRGS